MMELTWNSDFDDLVKEIHYDYLEYFGEDFILREEQKSSILPIINDQDTFVILPTGFGKTVIAVLATLMKSKMLKKDLHCLIICPLLAIIQEQVMKLKQAGLTAVGLTGASSPNDLQDLKTHKAQFIFATPESALPLKGTFRHYEADTAVCVADECHCISEMGLTFRPKYRSVGSLFASVFAPVLCTTATSTSAVMEDVKKQLCMNDVAVVAKLPNRPELMLHIEHSAQVKNLQWVAEELAQKGSNARKMMIFVRTINEAPLLFKFLVNQMCEILQTTHVNSNFTLFNFIHSKSTELTISSVIKEFKKPSSSLRLIITTSLLSMGVDFKDVDVVVLFGLPRSVSEFVQMSGRCARQSGQGLIVVYASRKSLKDCKDEYMRQLCVVNENGKLSVDECVRYTVMSAFACDERTNRELEEIKMKVCECDGLCEKCQCHLCKCCSFCSSHCKCLGHGKHFL